MIESNSLENADLSGLEREDKDNLLIVLDYLENYATNSNVQDVWLYGSSAYFIETDQEVYFDNSEGSPITTEYRQTMFDSSESYADIDILVERNTSSPNDVSNIDSEIRIIYEIFSSLEEFEDVQSDIISTLDSHGLLSVPETPDETTLLYKRPMNHTVFDIVFSDYNPGEMYADRGGATGLAHKMI